MTRLVHAGRILFGAWMLANGISHFIFPLWALPAGQEPLAMQLMSALVNSRLIDVALALQLVSGALVLTGFFVPVALCVVLPVNVCALYWAAVLDHQPVGAALALLAFALNGGLMLCYLDYYRDVLKRRPPALGEARSA